MIREKNVLQIRKLRERDRQDWEELFRGYCAFYQVPASDQQVDAVWAWLIDESHIFEGLVAEKSGEGLVGLAHFNPRPNPLRGCDTCYLSDLFVKPEMRGTGLGNQLYRSVMEVCRERGWPALNLLTQQSNETAQALYDRYGEKTDFYWYATSL